MKLDLMGTTEISVLLGVSRQRADQLSRNPGFPKPVSEIAAGRIWLRYDVERWARAVGRVSGHTEVRPTSSSRRGESRRVGVEALVDARAVAERLGLAHRQTVHNLVSRYPDFPPELGMWGRTRLWAWPDIERWARGAGRIPDDVSVSPTASSHRPGEGRQVNINDLVDAREVAERLGLAHRQTVHGLLTRYPDFPAPLGMWGRTRIWAWPDVERWAREHGRIP